MDLLQKIRTVHEDFHKSDPVDMRKPLEAIESITTLRRRIESFDLYKKYLDGQYRFLDWGCKHGIISYMLYEYLSSQTIEIYGCDIREALSLDAFSQESKMIYSPLEHPYQLPYEDQFFDVVISNGVLEHVPNDSESLKELYRTIKIDGYLIITFLPNLLSYTEFIGSQILKKGHMRKYSLREIKRMLLHSGFYPLKWGYHQVLPSLSIFRGDVEKTRQYGPAINALYSLNKYVEKVWPVYKFSANLYVVAQKRKAMK